MRPVAVRALEPGFASHGRFVASWASTASALAEAPSPHVEQVVDVIVDGARAHIVSEWIEGMSVAAWIAAHRTQKLDVPWPLAVEVAIEGLRGLRDMHLREVPLLHLGVSPAALRIAHDGTVKLTRFGAAAALARTGASRSEMEALGVPHAAPERISGLPPSPATDLFGVGALLFEMLAAASPFPAAAGGARDAQVRGEPPDLGAIRGDVPPLLVSLIERALRADPGERFSSADQMVRALTQLLRSHPATVGPDALAQSSREILLDDLAEDLAKEDLAEDLADAGPGASRRASAVPPTADAAAPPESAAVALAASLRSMSRPEARPQGLTIPQKTMHVGLDELTELQRESVSPTAEVIPQNEPTKEEAGSAQSPPAAQKERTMRYDFVPKQRRASTAAETAKRLGGLSPEESAAEPLPLTREKPTHDQPPRDASARRPRGLDPAVTEFLDEDQVDRLTVTGAERSPQPRGLSAAKTEFLDGDQVDRLLMPADRDADALKPTE